MGMTWFTLPVVFAQILQNYLAKAKHVNILIPKIKDYGPSIFMLILQGEYQLKY